MKRFVQCASMELFQRNSWSGSKWSLEMTSPKLVMNGLTWWRPLGSLLPSLATNTKSVRRTQPLFLFLLRRNLPTKNRNGRTGLAKSRAAATKLLGGQSATALRTGAFCAARSRAASKLLGGARPTALRTGAVCAARSRAAANLRRGARPTALRTGAARAAKSRAAANLREGARPVARRTGLSSLRMGNQRVAKLNLVRYNLKFDTKPKRNRRQLLTRKMVLLEYNSTKR